MEFLKTVSRSMLMALAGIVIVLLSLSEHLELGSLKYTSDSSTISRAILLSLGLGLLVTGVILEITSLRKRSSESHQKEPQAGVSVDKVFNTVDELPSLEARVQGAYRVSILARTAFHILNGYQRLLQDLGEAGCDIGLIIVDPMSDASNYLYGSQLERYKANLATSVPQISQLKKSLGRKFTFRVTSDVPPFSLVHIERKDGESSLIVQLNFMHSRISQDRLVFRVSEKDNWYKAFVDELDKTWNGATEIEDFDETIVRDLGWLT